jgi:hypothetical protein
MEGHTSYYPIMGTPLPDTHEICTFAESPLYEALNKYGRNPHYKETISGIIRSGKELLSYFSRKPY